MRFNITKSNIKYLYWGKNNHRLMWAADDFNIIFTYDGFTMYMVENDPDLITILESLKPGADFCSVYSFFIGECKNIILKDLTLDDIEANWITSDKIRLISFRDQEGNKYIFNRKFIEKKLWASRYRYDIWKKGNYYGMYVREYDQDGENGHIVKLILGVRR